MARIEIPFEEYSAFKEKINNLEKDIVNTNKLLNEAKEKIDIFNEILYGLENETLFRRIFKWNEVLKPFNDALATFKENITQ